jgi:hypothetical protein
MQGVKASTLGRRLAAIRYAHKLADLPSPTDSEASPKAFIARREWEDRIGDIHSNRKAGSTIAVRALKAEKEWRSEMKLAINLHRRQG